MQNKQPIEIGAQIALPSQPIENRLILAVSVHNGTLNRTHILGYSKNLGPSISQYITIIYKKNTL